MARDRARPTGSHKSFSINLIMAICILVRVLMANYREKDSINMYLVINILVAIYNNNLFFMYFYLFNI